MAVIIPCRLRLSGAKVPCRMSSGAVGFDLWGAKLTRRNGVYCFDTGVEMELPVGFAGLLVARSSVVCSGLEMMGSGVQVIDPDHRGTVKVLFRKSDSVQDRGAASLLRKPTVAYYEGQRVAGSSSSCRPSWPRRSWALTSTKVSASTLSSPWSKNCRTPTGKRRASGPREATDADTVGISHPEGRG